MASSNEVVDVIETSHNPTSSSKIELLTFQPTLDFNAFIKQHLLDTSSEKNDKINELIMNSAHIVGQERDGSILFTWDAPRLGSEKIVTHVGIYSPLSPTSRTLYTHDSQIDICGATIDSKKALLGFTICDKMPVSINYDTYVAEINPCNRVFSMNLSSTDFRKLQFIHTTHGAMSSQSKHSKHTSQSKLLVIIPDNWVCLYSFQIEPIERGFTVVNQPVRSVVVNDLPWYQWDSKLQWLSYARFNTISQSTQTRKDVSDNMVIIHVVGFSGRGHSIVLTISLPVPLSRSHYLTSPNYYLAPLAFSLPVHELNMKIFHNQEDLWCVCLQHTDGRISSPSQRKTGHSLPKEGKIEYSVYLLHNGHEIEGEVILPEPTTEGHHIEFMLMGNFVLAYIPNVMFHLLNVGSHTDPCHHLVLNHLYAPSLPKADNSKIKGRRVLGTAISNSIISDLSCCVLDPMKSVFYSCKLDPHALLNLFTSSEDPDLRVSLLHLMLVGFRHYSFALQMVQHICQTPLTLDDPRLFQEFIVALSYTNILPECQPYLARHIPLTNSLTYRGSIYKDIAGVKYAMLRCIEIQDFVKQLLVQSDQKLVSASPDTLFTFQPNPTEPLQGLCYHAVLNQSPYYGRLNLMDISSQVAVLAMSTPVSAPNVKKGTSKHIDKAVDTTSTTLTKSGKFVDRIKDLIQSPKGSHDHQSTHVSTLTFLLPDEDQEGSLIIRSGLFRDRLMHTLSTNLRLQAKNATSHVSNTAKNYWAELQRSSQILLHVIWQSLNFSNTNHPLQSSLHRPATYEEEVLFELLESYQMVHTDLGIPPPSGFATLFICIGYLCLEPSVFVNYLRNKVFTPTKYFLQLLFSDCDGVDDQFLFEIVSHISLDMQKTAMKHWKHPVLMLFLSRDGHTK